MIAEPPRQPRAAARMLIICAVWMIGFVSLLTIAVNGDETSTPDDRAIIRMIGGLLIIWVVIGGSLQRWQRDRFVRWLRRFLPGGWRTQFVIGCIIFALLEEAVTTAMTNLGPAFGAATGAAHITASTNYFEVVLLNSVIVFVPMFITWAWLLARYDFRPAEVMLLYGLTGTLAETISFGPLNLVNVGMWVYVYGLIVYLPARAVTTDPAVRPAIRNTRRVRWRHWPLAIVLPIVMTIPWIPVVLLMRAAAKIL
ncbi:MAG: hypothetical protein JXA10_15520 [Anaerolineae bacterium]|nr:hypothetical protein [Anaerolineae bacterium]